MTTVRNRDGRGRPEKVYSLSEAALGDNVSALAKALLSEAGSNIKMEALAHLILDGRQFAGQSMNKRLVLLIEKLNEMHYQARWEAGSGGPRVIMGRCPYTRVIDGHPQICKMDEALLSSALERTVSPVRRTESQPGLCPFLFEVR